MAQLELIDTATIGAYALPAIFNDDYTGLSDAEERNIAEWLDSYPATTIDCADQENEFARDAISGLMADCVTVNIYKLI